MANSTAKDDKNNIKDLNNIHIKIPKTLDFIKNDVETIINKDEKVIENYLERIVYTSPLSENTKIQLNTIFEKVRKDILSTI
jgi:hypothetical protein